MRPKPPISTRETAPVESAHGAGVPVLVVSSAAGVVTVPLSGKEHFTLGRSRQCDIPVPDESVSREHVILHARGAELAIEDLGSRNGTRIGGRRLTPSEHVPLALGAVVELGGATLVAYVPRAGAAPRESTPRPSRARVAPSDEAPLLADPSMQRLYALLDVIAPSPLPVLVLGETGTGKDVFARAVHARSDRAGGAFVALHCAAVPETLLESELFGHERGAFTGAAQTKLGLIETAHGGTLFLDEIGEMPSATQAKLLRVLESGEVLRVGSLKPRIVDFRVVAATNRDLGELVSAGRFRADLFYRLNGFSVTLPALRERVADIVPLAERFARLAAGRAGRATPALSGAAASALCAYAWPGNVRELRHVIERAVTLAQGAATIAAPHLQLPGGSAPPLPAGDDRQRIVAALERTFGNQTEAAKLLGISRRALSNRLDKHAIGRPRKKE